MVKHIILWTLKEEFSDAEKTDIKNNIKAGLESLMGVVPNLLDIKVNVNPLPTSNADLMLDSSFESYDALKAYAIHPAHIKVADTFVRPFTALRSCIDFEE